jgi:hypothetical protein
MAAISGFVEPFSMNTSIPTGGPLVANALRSMPAQKPRPAPVSTPAVSPSSPSSCSTARSRPWARSVLMAFIASGRLSVMRSTRPLASVRTAVFSASDMAVDVTRRRRRGPHRLPPAAA